MRNYVDDRHEDLLRPIQPGEHRNTYHGMPYERSTRYAARVYAPLEDNSRYPSFKVWEPIDDENFMEMRSIVQLLEEGPFYVVAIQKVEPMGLYLVGVRSFPGERGPAYEYRVSFLINGVEYAALIPYQTLLHYKKDQHHGDPKERAKGLKLKNVVSMLEANMLQQMQKDRSKHW